MVNFPRSSLPIHYKTTHKKSSYQYSSEEIIDTMDSGSSYSASQTSVDFCQKRSPPDSPISPQKIMTEDFLGNAQVEGVIVDLSPLKRSRSKESKVYFDGHLSDEKQQIRFVGFSDKLHEDLSKFHQKKEPVLLRGTAISTKEKLIESHKFSSTKDAPPYTSLQRCLMSSRNKCNQPQSPWQISLHFKNM